MATVPTGQLERELRALYLRWVRGMSEYPGSLDDYIEQFRRESTALINRMGGDVARRGVAASFPAPRELNLSPMLDHVYDTMKQAAIQQGISLGLNARDIAQSMLRAGLDQSYNSLERLTRTEVVSAYWANQWGEADGLGLVLVWSAENSNRTCPYCLAKDGLVVESPTVRDHPNGRCTLLPKLPHRVGLRGKSRNPHFNRRGWDGQVPQELDQALGRGLDHALVANRSAQQAITGMVSQGWTSSEAARYMISQPGMSVPNLTREGWSQILRALETYSQELWEGLSRNITPSVLYRGGAPSGYLETGLASWATNRLSAETYALRNGGDVYEMQVPRGIYAYQLKNNTQQGEFLVLGTPRITETVASPGSIAPVQTGVLDAPTPLKEAPVP